jgi:hypothetical protein
MSSKQTRSALLVRAGAARSSKTNPALTSRALLARRLLEPNEMTKICLQPWKSPSHCKKRHYFWHREEGMAVRVRLMDCSILANSLSGISGNKAAAMLPLAGTSLSMTSEKVPFCFEAIRRWYADSMSGIVFMISLWNRKPMEATRLEGCNGNREPEK